MVRIHALKIDPEYYTPVLREQKNFEIRKNDRNFKVGDLVLLEEWTKQYGYHFSPSIKRQITYITNYKQKPGYVVFGMKPVEED